MKTILFYFALLTVAWINVDVMAQERAHEVRKGPPVTLDADATTKAQQAIRQSGQAFTDAFNRGDAKAVAALWTPGGEYIDESGARFAGRAAIEKEYARFFADHQGAKIHVTVDSLRVVGDNTAIEDGRSVVDLGRAGTGGSGQYTAVHTKTDGKWLMSSVRDTQAASASGDQLQDLAWLVGSWSAEENGAKMDVQVRWIADKSYLERSYAVKRDGKIVASGTQIIGWNPQAQRIQSWNFTSDGGHAIGSWAPGKNGWSIETTGMTSEGTTTQATNIIRRIDDNAISWQSVERSAGGVRLADAEEVLLKRATTR